MCRRLLAVAAVGLLIAAPRAVAADAKYVKLVNAGTGKVLSIENDSTDAEARAVLAKDGDSESQQWQLVKDGDHYKLVNRKSGKVLDVAQESTDEDAPIIQWDGNPRAAGTTRLPSSFSAPGASRHQPDALTVRRSAGPSRRPSCDRNSNGLTGRPVSRSTSSASSSPFSKRQRSPHWWRATRTM